MNRSSYYLKQNVVAEPLVDGWHAWAHLIPPATLSRNITERQGQELWLNHVMSIKYTGESNPIIHSNRLMATCQTRGIRAERLFGEKEILLD